MKRVVSLCCGIVSERHPAWGRQFERSAMSDAGFAPPTLHIARRARFINALVPATDVMIGLPQLDLMNPSFGSQSVWVAAALNSGHGVIAAAAPLGLWKSNRIDLLMKSH